MGHKCGLTFLRNYSVKSEHPVAADMDIRRAFTVGIEGHHLDVDELMTDVKSDFLVGVVGGPVHLDEGQGKVLGRSFLSRLEIATLELVQLYFG